MGISEIPDKTVIQGAVSGDGFQDIRFDASTHAAHTITYAHHEIHSGSSYCTAVGDSNLGSAGTIMIYFTTPNSTDRLHFVPAAQGSLSTTFDLIEGATVTAGTGSILPIYNRNRVIGTSGTVLDNTNPPVEGRATKDPTGLDAGTIIYTDTFGGKKVGGGNRDLNEWVLKQDTTYIARITSNINSNVVSMALNWYEHTDRS